MKWMKRISGCICMALIAVLLLGAPALADEIGDPGSTSGGGKGTNTYTFYYSYDSAQDAIVLTVRTKRPIVAFGNTTSHTFLSAADKTDIPASGGILGRSLDLAIADMNFYGGYQIDAGQVKAKLLSYGFTDNGKGIWKLGSGFFTYIDARKVRPVKHTVHYDANGGTGAPGDQEKEQGKPLWISGMKPERTGYTFRCWSASIGGQYRPGDSYTHDQDGGTVTMTAQWADDMPPSVGSFYAYPGNWSAGNGTIGFEVQDSGSGIASITLLRYSDVTKSWTTAGSWSCGGTAGIVSHRLTEMEEGVFYYRLIVTDCDGNTVTRDSSWIRLDHNDPVLRGLESTNTAWTNIAPVIRVSATDYLYGTMYTGSGIEEIRISNDSGTVVAAGRESASYTLQNRDEGIHTWTVVVRDNVGHTVIRTVKTRYDITAPGLDGTEITHVMNGVTYSGYCQDNIISQHADDEAMRSRNHPNVTSGLRKVSLYKVKDGAREQIVTDRTAASWGSPDTHSDFDVFYDINQTGDDVDYYILTVQDFAGNISTKKLTSQRTLLTLFHTSIDSSTYR